MKSFVKFFTLLALVFAVAAPLSAQMAKKDATMAKHETMTAKATPTVIQLSQTEGQYTAQLLSLPAGDYIFEVTNLSVEKDLGFYLQDGTEAQVANSGLAELIGNGETSRTGVVTLTPGTYQYSCPLNPTPHYQITVK
ncbi:MAG: hypothetical protein AAFN92_23690 [Bacteroidota bacterium]